MKKSRLSFKRVYLIYLMILAAAVAGIVTYVYLLLQGYEASLPERLVERTVSVLVEDAAGEDFFGKYSLPETESGKFEEKAELEKRYLAMYDHEQIEFCQATGLHAEDELLFDVQNNGVRLAQVKLKAAGPAVTRLAVLSFREWHIEDVKPMLEKKEYTLSVPTDFAVRVNGIKLTEADGVVTNEKEITYTLRDLYLEPEFEIRDQNGTQVSYAIDGSRVLAEFYNYTLVLPRELKVALNGKPCRGEQLDEERMKYEICTLKKPDIHISDDYGNVFHYEGETEIPLTCVSLTADSRDTVKVSGAAVSEEAVRERENPEYAALVHYVEELPQIREYRIAVLDRHPEITITDEAGNVIIVDPLKPEQDFSSRIKYLNEVPKEVSEKIDVLDVAQKWSLFMSDDLPFAQIAQHLVSGSYQYEVAQKYATGVDITFTSSHVLLDPAFTENEVSHFTWITDNCFSVDISFVKHMRLTTGRLVDDFMNDRFYFIWYDDTGDNFDNPAWKIVSMREIVRAE